MDFKEYLQEALITKVTKDLKACIEEMKKLIIADKDVDKTGKVTWDNPYKSISFETHQMGNVVKFYFYISGNMTHKKIIENEFTKFLKTMFKVVDIGIDDDNEFNQDKPELYVDIEAKDKFASPK